MPSDIAFAAAPPPDLARFGEGRINIRAESELIARIIDDARAGRGGTVFTLNLDHLVKLDEDPAFRTAYDAATYVTADGVPVVMMARHRGVPVERVTGADLVVPLCRAAARAGLPVHFFGTSDDVLARVSERLADDIPGLVISGTEAPPYGFPPTGEAARAAADRIVASGAKICFLALGAPKQELFAHAAREWTSGVTFLCIGAALDFVAGDKRRAPGILQRLGLEWAFRLAQEPRRLIRRYVRSALFLLRYVAGEVFRGTGEGRG